MKEEIKKDQPLEKHCGKCSPDGSELRCFRYDCPCHTKETGKKPVGFEGDEFNQGYNSALEVLEDYKAELVKEIESKRRDLFENPPKNSQAEMANRDHNNYNSALKDIALLLNEK